MRRLHQRPDAVMIETDAGSYQADPNQFKRDHGTDFPSLPEGITERLYDPGFTHSFKQGISVVDGGPLIWPEGDAILAQSSKLMARQDTQQHYDNLFARMQVEQVQSQDIDEVKRRYEADQAEVDRLTADNKAKFDRGQAEAAALAAENKARFEAQQEPIKNQPPPPPPNMPNP